MSKTFLTALILSLAIPMLVSAQGPRGGFSGGFGRQWWENPVANGLNLTDTQSKQIHGIVAEYRAKLIDLRAVEEKAQGDLQDVFNDTPGDQRKANDAIDRLANARSEVTRTISQMSLRLRNVLTSEQWQQLRERQANRPRRGLLPPGPDSKAAPDSNGAPRRRPFGPDGRPVQDSNQAK